jgi:hypothetical protein
MIPMKTTSADAFSGFIEALVERVAERLSRDFTARSGNLRPAAAHIEGVRRIPLVVAQHDQEYARLE